MKLFLLLVLVACCVAVHAKKQSVAYFLKNSIKSDGSAKELLQVEQTRKATHSTGSSSVVTAPSSSSSSFVPAAERKASSLSSIVYINCVMFLFYLMGFT